MEDRELTLACANFALESLHETRIFESEHDHLACRRRRNFNISNCAFVMRVDKLSLQIGVLELEFSFD